MAAMNLDTVRWAKRILAVAVVAGVASALLPGDGLLDRLWPCTRTENAYVAFGQEEWTRPAPKLLEPIALAELAIVDERLAERMRTAVRVHRPGTLATLEYVTVGSTDEVLDRWRVRAIVPMLGAGGDLDAEAWGGAPPNIVSGVEAQGGVILYRSGDTGLPAEVVLRLRVGETIEMAPPDNFGTTDVRDGRRDAIRDPNRAQPASQGTRPVRLRISLVEACAADVRLGRTVQVEYAPFAPVPIPVGLRVRRWVQMTGCSLHEGAVQRRPG